MSRTDPRLLLHTGPHLKREITTPRLMVDVLIALVPVVAAATWYFGLSALLVLAAATLGAVATEAVFTTPRGRTLGDGSAALTGLLLGLTLPPGIPLWMAFVGGVAAIALGKLVWGGLGHNLFNPALVGRAFLQASFPTTLTTWSPSGGAGEFLALRGQNLALPFMRGDVDAVTSATPLSRMKFDHDPTPITDLFWGHTSGSLGETSAAILVLVGGWLLLRRAFDWRIPLGVLASVAVFSTVLHLIAPAQHPSGAFMLLSGGVLFGAVFMATDPVTSPLEPRGAWVFGLGIGFLVVLIRRFGGMPEGVMYAILLMNAATPLLERVDQPRAFGHERSGA